ncbi:MAG TPA: ATP-dependent DNA ligase [Gaiellaceae bacterium]|nr:ATP-dependent DNA ligase [Gaiellaceae bacterium]
MPGKNVPFPPMEAQLVNELPVGDSWQYEPKWDGFRGVLENDGGELALWSRNGRPLLRYFPELEELDARLPPHSALDGEIVIEDKGRLEFDLLQMRLHPAASRVQRLAAETPARFVCFDVLLWKGEPVWKEALAKRRKRLEKLPFEVSPASTDPEQARWWLDRLDAIGLDGVVAKRLESAYLPGSRDAVQKVKEHRSAECVVVGVRWKAKPTQLATLLLGLYEKDGRLDYVGSCAVAAGRQQEILALVKPLLKGAPERGFSEPNRWGTGGLEESAIRPEVVVEVRYDKVQGNRFRHGTRLLRFRPDKDAADCTWAQVRPKRRRDDPTVEKLLGG